MSLELPTPWVPYHVIEWGNMKFEVFSRIEVQDDFTNRMRFMLAFPNGAKRVLALASSKNEVDIYEAQAGFGSHKEIIHDMVIDEALKAIKATFPVPPKCVQPNVKLVPLDMENPIQVGVDFAKVEAQMMAHMVVQPPSSSGPVYGPSIFAGSAVKIAKAQKVMEDAFKKLASGFVKAAPTWDSLAGASKTEILKTLYGGGQESEQPVTPDGDLDTPWDGGAADKLYLQSGQFSSTVAVCEPKELTPMGLATLERFGVALVG